MDLMNYIFLLLLTTLTIATAPPIDVVFIIQSEDTNNCQSELSNKLKDNLMQQSFQLKPNYRIHVHLLHEIFNYPGGWTIHNLIPKLLLLQRKSHTDAHTNTNRLTNGMEIISNKTRWIVFCEHRTRVNLKLLLERLTNENHTQLLYLGHPLYDREPTIIHHFAFFENPKWFPYPMLQAGVVFSFPLFKSINDIYANQTTSLQRSEFSIDAAHELARFIYDNVQNSTTAKRQKIILKKASYICSSVTGEAGSMNSKKYHKHDEVCAMHVEQQTNAESSMTCIPVKREEIYFAVKTCSKYHNERLPIIQNTWALYAKHVKYFSDVEDATIPTVSTGLPNVEMGHCAKTLQILKLALRDIENYNKKQQRLHHVNQEKHGNHQIKWLFLTDDDTLLSISGVCQVLGCYNSMDEIYLGERYGYRLYGQDGFNYITGGGGIAFSLPVVKLVLQHCSCPSPSAPDDMILGSCLHTLEVKALHSSRFHQARPSDYPLELLKQDPPVSFHKFWQLDPFDVYSQWFEALDHQLLAKEKFVKENLIDDSQRSKTVKLLAKTENLNFNEMPVSLVGSLHHTKERHLDL